MPSNHLILCCPLLLLPSILHSIRVFSKESVLHIRWPKYWSFSISPSNEYSRLISFMIDWYDLLAVQGTLKSLLQHHSSKASVLQCSAFFMVQLSHLYMTIGKTIALITQTFVRKVMSLLFTMLYISSVQLLSHVWLFVTPWAAAPKASLSITNSQSLLKLMSIKSVMPSNHLILFHPLLLLPSIFSSIRVFSNESIIRIRWPNYWSFSFSSSNEYSGLISFRIDSYTIWPLVKIKLNIQKTKIMESSPITSWQIDGKTVETLADFILGGSKITADGDCSHEIKRCLLLGRKITTNLDGILKNRNITLPTKVCLVKAMVFPSVMYGCESWTIKKAECRRIGAFELWCWRRLLGVPRRLQGDPTSPS